MAGVRPFWGIYSVPAFLIAMSALLIGFAFMPDGPWWRRLLAALCIAFYERMRYADSPSQAFDAVVRSRSESETADPAVAGTLR